MADKPAHFDREIERYRNLLETPTEFKDGFGWATVVGVFFCGLVMMPGSIYLGLMTGGNIGSAATWVTVILFAEVARRALKSLSKQQLVVLLYAAGAMSTGGVFLQLVQRAYFVSSEPFRDAGMRDSFPAWYAPHPDSPAILERNFFHPDWLAPIALLVFMMVIGFVTKYTLGYFLFRLTSDVERLPFPLAPIQAQGAMAMAEEDNTAVDDAKQTGLPGEAVGPKAPVAKPKSARWRLFSLGIVIGIAFGFLQVGIPAITGLIFDKPFYLIPQPWIETTTMTESVLPATPTGLVLDLGVVFLGMVLPFWAVIGSAIAIASTLILNPILYKAGVLDNWQPGMDTVNASFSNSVDFWMSFGIGTGLGIAVVSVFQTVRDVRRRLREQRERRAAFADEPPRSIWAVPANNRGDYSMWLALIGWALAATALVVTCYLLLPKNLGLLLFLVFFAFIYSPLISYVNARLLGIAGQTVEIPFLKETSFILSGAKGIEIWLAPIPIENYGAQAQAFRINELTGVSFRSLIKLDLVVTPVSFLLSLLFWSFIWHSGPIPSDVYPWAQVNWELQAKQNALLYSATFVPPGQAEASIMDSQFMEAIHPTIIGSGFAATVVGFTLLSTFGLPVLLVYGLIRGFGVIPHTMALEFVGALIGRFYLQKKFGADQFLRGVPTFMAGYSTGVGLIAMATIALRLIQQAISSAPF